MQSFGQIEIESVNCNLCGRDTTVPFRKYGDWQVVQCANCGLKYLNPRPTGSQLAKLYSASYFDSRFSEDNIQAQIQRNIVSVNSYEKLLGKKGSLLDVGCGFGFLVAAAQRQNWYAKGIDISAEAVAFGTTQLGVNLERAVPESWTADRTYNVVVSSHSLEHVSNPRETLQSLKSFMQPTESVLHIRVPNIGSMDRKWHGDLWRGWDLPFHFYFYEPRTLTTLLKQVGFKDVTVTNDVFDPFSHLLADLQTGKSRSDGPDHIPRALKARQGFVQQGLYGLSRVYRVAAHRLNLNRMMPDRDFNVWARISE